MTASPWRSHASVGSSNLPFIASRNNWQTPVAADARCVAIGLSWRGTESLPVAVTIRADVPTLRHGGGGSLGAPPLFLFSRASSCGSEGCHEGGRPRAFGALIQSGIVQGAHLQP